MWKLLWVLVVVGVAGGVAKKKEEGRLLTLEEIYKLELKDQTQEQGRKSCWSKDDVELCRNGFLFTATALSEVRGGGDLAVALSLERSLHPNVTFDLSLRTLGDRELEELSDEEEWPEETILVRKKVTLEVSELRRVVLKVSDLPWRTAYLVVTALRTGYSESGRHTYTRIQKVTSDASEVFVQAEKSSYAPGDTVNFRALVVDTNVDKSPKFAQVILSTFNLRLKETRLPWVEVPRSGILRGYFKFDVHTNVKVRVTSDVTSSDTSMVTTPTLRIFKPKKDSRPSYNSYPSDFMSVRLEGLSDVSFSQPRLKGRVKLTSLEGLPLDGNCSVTISDAFHGTTKFANKMAERRVTASREFEFDVVEELGAERKGAGQTAKLNVKAKCRHVQSGSVVDATETIRLHPSLFEVDLLSVETLPEGNSGDDDETTVVLKFLVDRRDGGSVEEEEPKKGLHVKLLLSDENLRRLRPSATNFSLPIPPDGRVRLKFQVNQPPPSPWEDRIRMEVGDATEEARLDRNGIHLEPTIRVTLEYPALLIRRGGLVPFRVRSCLPYDNVNVILSSRKTIYFSRRFSFYPREGEELDEVIELTMPRNATEGSLLLTVSGRNKIKDTPYGHTKMGERTSLKLNLLSSHEEQFIRIVDQVDVDMSTIVTLRLEGMFPESVVSLQAAKMESPEEKEDTESPLKCYRSGDVSKWEYAGIWFRDDSPGDVKPGNLEISTNFDFNKKLPSDQHPPLVFFDFDRKTSTQDNGTLTVTWTFDRLTEFGTYVVSGATFNWKWGRTVFSNSPVFKIPPPPGTLDVFVAPSVPSGESYEVISYSKNTRASSYAGYGGLESSDEGSSEEGSSDAREEIVKVKPTALKVTNLKKNDHTKKLKKSQSIGDLFDSLSSKFPADSQLRGKSNI